MKALTLVLFDDSISGTGVVWYSPDEYSEELGEHDQIGVHAAVSNVSGTLPTLTVNVEHSADGQNWLTARGYAPWGSAQGLPEISTAIGPNATYSGSDTGLDPVLLGFVRLKVTLGGTGPKCRLKLAVTCRDF